MEKPQLNLMFDLETASTRQDAIMLSIAIVPFNPNPAEPVPEVDHYYEVIDMISCWLEGDKPDEDTQQWWMRQDARAKMELINRQGKLVRSVMREVYNYLCYLAEQYELIVWSQGIDFDFPIFEHAINKYVEPKELPYKYYNKRDTRTILKWCGVDYRNFERKGIAHNALDDCKHQISLVHEAYKRKLTIDK